MKAIIITLSAVSLTFSACTSEKRNTATESAKTTPEKKITAMETSETPPTEPTEKVIKTDQEWQAQLTPEQYRVARQSGTELAGGKVYQEFKKQGSGSYHCVGCGAKLFSSEHKFDAKCGWPAFYDPAKAQNVKTTEDYSHGMIRTEVTCAKCDAHLGHLFKGEGHNTPKDQRYCINGIVLKFVPDLPEKK